MSELKVSDILKKKSGAKKATLEVDLPDLKIICPIRWETMNSKDIKEKHKVEFKDSIGRVVRRHYVGEKKTLKWLTEDGMEAIGEPIAYQDGQAVAPFTKSEDIKIKKTAPKEIKDDFLIERTLELWGEEVDKLYKLADYLHSNSLVGLSAIVPSQGYDTQFLAIVEPRFEGGNKFGFLVYLTRKKIEFNHLLDIADIGKRKTTARAKTLDLVEGVLI